MRTPEEVFADFAARRRGILRALGPEYVSCLPLKETERAKGCLHLSRALFSSRRMVFFLFPPIAFKGTFCFRFRQSTPQERTIFQQSSPWDANLRSKIPEKSSCRAFFSPLLLRSQVASVPTRTLVLTHACACTPRPVAWNICPCRFLASTQVQTAV